MKEKLRLKLSPRLTNNLINYGVCIERNVDFINQFDYAELMSGTWRAYWDAKIQREGYEGKLNNITARQKEESA